MTSYIIVGVIAFAAGMAFDYFVMGRTPKAERLRDKKAGWKPVPQISNEIDDEAAKARSRGSARL